MTALAPGRYRAMVTICAMSATIMQALDTTIANVALPHMQGSLSASLDQINWVLTSYIVAAAIMTAPIGWVADRFGRKRLFVICVVGFTLASVALRLCPEHRADGRSSGCCKAPSARRSCRLSQAVMLDSYSPT